MSGYDTPFGRRPCLYPTLDDSRAATRSRQNGGGGNGINGGGGSCGAEGNGTSGGGGGGNAGRPNGTQAVTAAVAPAAQEESRAPRPELSADLEGSERSLQLGLVAEVCREIVGGMRRDRSFGHLDHVAFPRPVEYGVRSVVGSANAKIFDAGANTAPLQGPDDLRAVGWVSARRSLSGRSEQAEQLQVCDVLDDHRRGDMGNVLIRPDLVVLHGRPEVVGGCHRAVDRTFGLLVVV
jgi:hypothetical protein